MLKAIKTKITIIGDGFEFSFTEDYTEYAKDLIKCNNVFSDTNEPITRENIRRYFKDSEFKDKDIEKLNGNHFLYGFLESLGQSEECPEVLFNYEGDLLFKTELI